MVLCKGVPDLVTTVVREMVGALDPFLRSLHQGVDLSKVVGYAQNFLGDLIATVNSKEGREVPSVEDFAALLRRRLHSCTRMRKIVKSEFLLFVFFSFPFFPSFSFLFLSLRGPGIVSTG